MITLSQIQKIQIPTDPWVYIFKTWKDKILYIWKAKNLKKRIWQYFAPWSVWKQDMLSQADNIQRIKTNSEQEALFLEESLIKQHQPEFNRLLKNNTQYVYIKISKEKFPQISITRKKTSDSNFFIWPKNHTKNLKKFLSYIKSFYKLRDCSNSVFKKWKLCTKYDFWLCKWWCNNISTNEEELLNDESYQKIVKKIKEFFNGKTNFIKKDLFEEINKAIEKQNFERAGQLKEFYMELNDRTERQTVILNKDVSGIVWQISKINIENKITDQTSKKSGFYVFSISKIVDWKIIDVIRWKEFAHEIDFSTLIQNIQNEFNIKIDQKQVANWWLQDVIHFQNLNKKISSKELSEIRYFLENSVQSFIASDSFQTYSIMNELLQTIQNKYFLQNFPYKIECIDISHFQGERTSGGLSCMIWGLPYPKGYRRYKIKTSQNNDYKSIKEVLTRRFQKNKKDFPDLFIIDGWIWQLNIVKNVILENKDFSDIFANVDFLALWKWEARDKNKINIWKIKKTRLKKLEKKDIFEQKKIAEKVYFFNKDFDIVSIDIEYNESDKILTKIRDEAHRFANLYREKQMQKDRS